MLAVLNTYEADTRATGYRRTSTSKQGRYKLQHAIFIVFLIGG
jgi:hypothetical protein